MKLPNCLKNLNSRKENEKGSVTLFVLIAMLFFLMIGMMIFIINMNTETSQKRDVEKIKSEYNANTSETDLDQLYQEAKQRQIGTFMIKLIDKYGKIYNSGEWVNENWLAEGRLPLTVQPNFPEGLKDISVTVKDDTYGGSTIITKTADLATMEIRADKDCQYTIENTLDNTNQVKINIDTTKPTIDELKGGTIWKGTEEEEITGTDAGGAITITARDNLSGVKELKYIINNSPEAPSADAEWTTVEGATAQVTINNENDLGVYYIHAMATDVAGNVRDVVTSGPYEVKQANYKITTTTGTTYSETLKDAAEKPGAMVIKVLNTFTDEVPATIAQNVTIDTNGKTLTMAETITVASGATATFVDTAETKGKLERTTGQLITNNGTTNVGTNSNDGANLNSNYIVIYGGNTNVNSGYLKSTTAAALRADSIVVNNGKIESEGRHSIIIENDGQCEIKGGTIEGASFGICPQNGTLKISGGEIKGTAYGIATDAPSHSFDLEMTNGTVSGGSYHGIHSTAENTNITIKGGTITGGRTGINSTGTNSIVTIGNNTNTLDRTSPVITGTNGYGVTITDATSTLNFYDGKIIGKTKALSSDGKRTYFGREVTFDASNDASVNFLTETEEGNVTRYYRPYTRQNEETHLFETVLEKQVNVTFNPGEGATVAESNRNVLTNVEYKEKAETAEIADLPIPTKTGYTFKGWNGKNLFDEESILMAIEGATKENNHYKFNNAKSRVKYGGDRSLPIGSFKENTSYTMSIYGYISASYWHIRFDYIDGTTQYGVFNITEEGKYDISSNANKTLKSIKLSYGNGATVFISHIQLEEGTTATAYEPYLVTAETKVTTASDHTLKAVWETIPYTISYELNKGTNNSSNPTSYTIESENITLQNPTRNGYTFIGWTGSNGDTPQTTVTIPKGSTGNKTYTANWKEKTYTLTIKPNGGALDGSTTDVVRNLKYSDVSNINVPIKTGYTFGGYNELSGAAYNNGLASMEVYNNNNNGVVTVTSQAKSADNPISGMSNEVKITNAGTTETKPGLGGFIHRKTVTANGKYVHVFVAKLPEGYYFHNANNSLGTGATTQWLTSNEGTGKWQTYVYQVNAGSSGTFSSFGHVYVSTDKDNTWSVKPAETGAYTAYLAYSNIYDITRDDSGIGQIDGTGVLTAKWTATPYTVTLNAGDGTIDDGDDGWTRAGDNKTATKDITYDSNYGTLPTASRIGYTFEGWFTEATGGTQITDTTKMQTASAQTLYPHWTANPYTIHFNANGGTGEMADLPMTYGTPANLTANAFSRTGYKFVKWTSNADGTGNEYIDGQTVNNLTEINNDTVNLFAQWEERPFVVTFNPNGGIVTPESKEITYNSTYGDLPSGDNIKRLGYTFAGWYKEAELTNEVTAETTYDITEDSTLYAKWTPHVYTVTFNKNGGTGTMSDQSFTYGQTQNLRANTFTRTGYTFAGWARAENGTVEFTNEQSISNLTPENGGTITLYAVWNDVTRPSWSVRLLDIINK